jgi:hypothetical protein
VRLTLPSLANPYTDVDACRPVIIRIERSPAVFRQRTLPVALPVTSVSAVDLDMC